MKTVFKSESIPLGLIEEFQMRLGNHPIYQSITSIKQLQIFMSHHVYSVWDFMSLIKYLQGVVAPTTYPWTPQGDSSIKRFINELVLEEESDETHIEGEHSSHFELYLRAMEEVGADTRNIRQFIKIVEEQGIDAALASEFIPEPSRQFTRTTFDFIQSNQPHQVAAALALGREHVIPAMFRAFLSQQGITEQDAPIFLHYLKHHIHLDSDFHAPLSLRLLDALCQKDDVKTQQAINAAEQAISAREKLWDGVFEIIQ